MNRFNYYHRRIKDRIVALFCLACSALSISILALLLGYVVYQGVSALNLDFFTRLPTPVGEPHGGMLHSIVGTLLLIGIASAIGVPIGIATGLYLAEYGASRYAKTVRYLTDVLNGLPSIVMGLVAYQLLVVPMRHFSGLAGGLALSFIMIPIIVRTTEEVVKLVPQSLREGALALGIPQWKVTLHIIIRTAWSGIMTGVILAIARILGETAPLIFTAFGNQFIQINPLQPMSALTLQIYNYAISPYEEWHAKAWAGALVLILLSLGMNLIARMFTLKRR